MFSVLVPVNFGLFFDILRQAIVNEHKRTLVLPILKIIVGDTFLSKNNVVRFNVAVDKTKFVKTLEYFCELYS